MLVAQTWSPCGPAVARCPVRWERVLIPSAQTPLCSCYVVSVGSTRTLCLPKSLTRFTLHQEVPVGEKMFHHNTSCPGVALGYFVNLRYPPAAVVDKDDGWSPVKPDDIGKKVDAVVVDADGTVARVVRSLRITALH